MWLFWGSISWLTVEEGTAGDFDLAWLGSDPWTGLELKLRYQDFVLCVGGGGGSKNSC